jgi:hypothetical protein
LFYEADHYFKTTSPDAVTDPYQRYPATLDWRESIARPAYPDVPVPGPDSPEALHRGDPGQLRADAEHRRQLYALGKG